jgi:hypothetical protein
MLTLLCPLTALRYKREAKMLCKKIVNFFSLLSHTQEATGGRQTGVACGVTGELLSSVTGLAHYLKVLIRVALTSALRLVRTMLTFNFEKQPPHTEMSA